MIRQRFIIAAALIAATGAAACATDGPTAPPANATATASVAVPGLRRFNLNTTPAPESWADQPLTESQLKAIEQREKDRLDDAKEASKAPYEQLKMEWEAFKRTKPSPTASPYLMCEPKEHDGEAKIIGPDGGDVSAGQHKLRIPKGALTRKTVITAEVPTTTGVGIRFSPHGLQFVAGKEPTLEMKYDHCYLPDAAPKSIVYVNDAMEALEWPLTADLKDDDKVTGRIGHFSGYAVGWSRTRR